VVLVRRTPLRRRKPLKSKKGLKRTSKPKHKDWRKLPGPQYIMDTCHKCEICGSKYELDIHHRWPKSKAKEYKKKYGRSVHEESNLVMVCMKCHGRHDSIMGQAPSVSPSKQETNARNLSELCRKWGTSKFKLMVSDEVFDAYVELAFPDTEEE